MLLHLNAIGQRLVLEEICLNEWHHQVSHHKTSDVLLSPRTISKLVSVGGCLLNRVHMFLRVRVTLL